MEKFSRAGQATDDNMAVRLHTHELRICNTYFLSTTTMVRKRGSMVRYTSVACLVHIHNSQHNNRKFLFF